MRGAALDNLPEPPPGKTGWPWTVETPPLPNTTPGGSPWPRISIVSPSLNQGAFIEETIRSVLLQGYPNLEYIVIDGGSNDETVGIVKKYAEHLSFWVSEPDNSQSHAINKGFARATGDLCAYINSDDYYLPGTFRTVAEHYLSQPDSDLFLGRCRTIDSTGRFLRIQSSDICTFEEILDIWYIWLRERYIMQPEVFWARKIAHKVGKFREDLHYAMDYDYWCRILHAGGRIAHIDRELAVFRWVSGQKSRDTDATLHELHDIVYRWLWVPKLRISHLRQWQLQSKWLYQRVFLPMVARSEHAKEKRLRRWLALISCVLCHPKILLAPPFHDRLRSIASARIRALRRAD